MKMHLGAALAALLTLASPSEGALIHLYQFTADASDSVGSAHGTLVGGATVTGGALVLDGVNDYVQFASHIVPTSGSYTVAMFARETTPPGSFVEFISQGSSGGPGFYVGTDPAGVIRATDSWGSTGVAFAADNQFHHVALVVNSVAGSSQLFYNGLLQATLGFAITTTAGGTDTRLGRQFEPSLEFLSGALDNVAIYDHALSAGEIAALADTAAVPEPSTLLLSFAGLSYVAWRRRRRPGSPPASTEPR